MAIMAITAKNAHMTIMAMGDGNINAIQHHTKYRRRVWGELEKDAEG